MGVTTVMDRFVMRQSTTNDGREREELIHNGVVIASATGLARNRVEPLPVWPCDYLTADGRVVTFVPLPVRPEDV